MTSTKLSKQNDIHERNMAPQAENLKTYRMEVENILFQTSQRHKTPVMITTEIHDSPVMLVTCGTPAAKISNTGVDAVPQNGGSFRNSNNSTIIQHLLHRELSIEVLAPRVILIQPDRRSMPVNRGTPSVVKQRQRLVEQ